MNFHCITVVWGQSYTDLFLKVALPSLLTEGNMGALRDQKGSLYRILTKSADAERMRQSTIFQRLQDFIAVDVVLIDTIEVQRKHCALTECHKLAVATADEAKAALIFLSPDAVWSDGAFRKIVELISKGKRVVMIAGIRILKETFTPAFLREYLASDGLSAAISSRDLVKLALQHLHPYSRSLFWDAAETNFSPSHFYWNVPDEGMLLRCFHLHPFAVNPQLRGQSVAITVDHDYFSRACPNLSDTYIVEDSDELIGIELSAISDASTQTILKGTKQRYNIIDVANRVKSYTTPFHRNFIGRTIRFHYQDFSPRWKVVEEGSDRIVSELLFTLNCTEKESSPLPIHPSQKKALSFEDNTPLQRGVSNLLGSLEHFSLFDGGYDYCSHLRLGLGEGQETLCYPSLPNNLLLQAKESLQFPSEKPIVAISPLNDRLELSLPLQPLLEFMEEHRNNYNFIVVGPCYESSQFAGVHSYWIWEYRALVEKIKTMPHVRSTSSNNVFSALAVTQQANYFISSYNRLAAIVSDHRKIPCLIIAPLFGEYASGHTAGGRRIFVNCDLPWGFTFQKFSRYFHHFVEGMFGDLLEQPYTSLCEGLDYHQYLKKLIWFRICALVFHNEQKSSDTISTALEWETSPFEYPLRENINWDEVLEGLTILWDLQAEIFQTDINAILFYAMILANIGDFQRGETILEKSLQSFVGNPFLTNNLSVCKWNLTKTSEALALGETLLARFPALETIRQNYETMQGRTAQSLQIFPFKICTTEL